MASKRGAGMIVECIRDKKHTNKNKKYNRFKFLRASICVIHLENREWWNEIIYLLWWADVKKQSEAVFDRILKKRWIRGKLWKIHVGV